MFRRLALPPSIIFAAFYRRKFFILFWFEVKFKDEKLLQVEAVDVAKGDDGVTQKSTLLFIACLREI